MLHLLRGSDETDVIGRGIVKQRYSDFVVREVSREGEVIHLKSIDASDCEKKYFSPKGETKPCTQEDIESFLESLSARGWVVDPTLRDPLQDYLLRSMQCDSSLEDELVTFSCASKEDRGFVHQLVKERLSNIVVADTVAVEGQQHIRLRAKFKLKRTREDRQERERWPPGKDFLRFTLLKENVVSESSVLFVTTCHIDSLGHHVSDGYP